jgi:hypothetical protein
VVSPQQKQAIREIANRLAEHVPCGLKDPRLLLLLDAWLDVVGSCALVGTFRHPAAVVRSLVARNPRMSEGRAYDLWLRYNSELVRWHKAYRFPIVEFDLADARTYCRTVAVVAMTLGLCPDMTRLCGFVSPNMDRNRSPKEPVPAACQGTYAYLWQHRYRPVISDDDFEAQLLAAQQRYSGWQWSPDKLRRALSHVKRFLPPVLVSLGQRWLRRLDRFQ